VNSTHTVAYTDPNLRSAEGSSPVVVSMSVRSCQVLEVMAGVENCPLEGAAFHRVDLGVGEGGMREGSVRETLVEKG